MSFCLSFHAIVFLSTAFCKQEKEESEGNADKDFTMTPMQFQSAPGDAILRDYFVPAPASTNMYWVTKSETVSSAPRNVGCETAYETITPNSNQEYDVRVKRLATLGFHCDYGIHPPIVFCVSSIAIRCFSCLAHLISISKVQFWNAKKIFLYENL